VLNIILQVEGNI